MNDLSALLNECYKFESTCALGSIRGIGILEVYDDLNYFLLKLHAFAHYQVKIGFQEN